MDEKTKRKIIMYLVAGAIIVAGCLSLRNVFSGRTGIQNNGHGIERVRSEFAEVRKKQSGATSDLQHIAGSAAELTEQIDECRTEVNTAYTSAERFNDTIDQAGRIIEECQQIIRTIRSRGEAENK